MNESSSASLPAVLHDLIGDPIVQLLMKADNVTVSDLAALFGAVGLQPKGSRMSQDVGDLPDYRPGVGMMLLNRNNRVFVGHRRKTKGSPWQMPQGGIDDGETPRLAALRELKEEVGTNNVDILAESRTWLCYDLPSEQVGKTWNGRWRGQRQKWFAMRFNGSDSDIKIDRNEFDDWKWVRVAELPQLIVPFKRALYASIIAEFHDAVAG